MGAMQRALTAANMGWPFTLLGQAVTAQFDVYEDEIHRRAEFNLGSVTSPMLLRTLASLPFDTPVPWTAISRHQQQLLRAAPDGCVLRRGGHVIRALTPPVRVKSVQVRARTSDVAVARAAQFAPYCERVAVASEARLTDTAALNARLYGVGLMAVTSTEDQRLVVAPAPFHLDRWTWAYWRLQESAWAQLSSPLRSDTLPFPTMASVCA